MKDTKENMGFVFAGVTLFAIIFTAYGFFMPQDCSSIDKEFLYCLLHPFTTLDLIGCIFFYGGLFLMSGVWTNWFSLFEEIGTTKWNWVMFTSMALGLILIAA